MTSFSSESEDTLEPPTKGRTAPRQSSARPAEDDARAEAKETGAETHGVLTPQPRPQPKRRPDRRVDADPGDPEGTHVCAPTDA